jgi:predicted NBD/HSP70 family sugar kinase
VSNSSALAEALFGAGKEEHDFIYLGIGDKIGSGVISQGELFRNSKGYAPEIGHVCIRPHGALCTCGNRGCLQSYASVPAVLDKLKSATGEDLAFKEFCEKASDEKVNKVFHELMDELLPAIVSSINILHPVSVILGDQGAFIPQKYLKYLENQINEHKFVQGYTNISVKQSNYKADVKIFGAVCNVIMGLFTGEIELPF